MTLKEVTSLMIDLFVNTLVFKDLPPSSRVDTLHDVFGMNFASICSGLPPIKRLILLL